MVRLIRLILRLKFCMQLDWLFRRWFRGVGGDRDLANYSASQPDGKPIQVGLPSGYTGNAFEKSTNLVGINGESLTAKGVRDGRADGKDSGVGKIVPAASKRSVKKAGFSGKSSSKFTVIDRSGKHFLARGQIIEPVGGKEIVHELRSKAVWGNEATALRQQCADRRLVDQLLSNEAKSYDRAVWKQVLYNGSATADVDGATHWLEFRYQIVGGHSAAIVKWLFDFRLDVGVEHAIVFNRELCSWMVTAMLEDRLVQLDKGLLLPNREAKLFWHVAIARFAVHFSRSVL